MLPYKTYRTSSNPTRHVGAAKTATPFGPGAAAPVFKNGLIRSALLLPLLVSHGEAQEKIALAKFEAEEKIALVKLDTYYVADAQEVSLEKNILPTRPVNSSLYGFDTSVQDSPRSIQQISPDQLKNDVITNGQDLARYAPGLSRNFANGTASAPFIRGQSPDQYQNGIRVGRTVPFTNNSIELVDIVAGPASTIFGPAASTSGYVNYITKKPYFDKARAELRLEFGDYHVEGQSNNDFKQTLDFGGPLVKDRVAYRLSIQGRAGNNFYGTADERTKNPQNHIQVFGALTWIPNSKWAVDTNVQYNNLNYSTSRGFNRVTQDLVDNGRYITGANTPIILLRTGVTAATPGAVRAPTATNANAYGLFVAPTFTGRTDANPTGYSPTYRLVTLNGAYGATRSVTVTNTPVAVNGAGQPQISFGAAPGAQRTGALVGYVLEPQNVAVQNIKQNRSYTYGDQQQVRQYQGQNRITYNLSDTAKIRNNFYAESTFSKSAQLYRTTGTITDEYFFDNRTELLLKREFKLFGLDIKAQSNSGIELRYARTKGIAGLTLPYTGASDLFDPRTIPTSGVYGKSIYDATPEQTAPTAYINAAFGDVTLPARPAAYAVPGYAGYRTNPASTNDGKLTTLGVYSQHEFKLADPLLWIVGGRASVVFVDYTNPVIPATGGRTFNDRTTQLVPAGNTSLVYKPVSWASTYATFAYTQAVNTGDGAALTNGTLASSQFHSEAFLYELGSKFELIPNSLYASVAGFWQLRDLAPAAVVNEGVTSFITPTIKARGVESSVQYQPDPSWSIYANFSWGETNYVNHIITANKSPGPNLEVGTATPAGVVGLINQDQGNAAFAQGARGNYRVSLIPKYSLNVGTTYQFESGFGVGANFTRLGTWNYFLTSTIEIPEQYTLDASFFYAPRKSNWDVRVVVSNVTNQWGLQPNGAENVNDFIAPLPPLGVRGAVTFRF